MEKHSRKLSDFEGPDSISPHSSKKKFKAIKQSEDGVPDAVHRTKKSIEDLVKLAVSKEESRSRKKKKREKLKTKQKMRAGLVPQGSSDEVSKKCEEQKSRVQLNGSEKVQILETKKQAKVQKFGSWFPTAFKVKGDSTTLAADSVSIVLFYQYVEPPWPETRKQKVAISSP